jgi:hypothetical protein
MNRENIQLTAKITARDTEALYDIARSRGIQMPHPALGIFTSVLAEIERPNGNGVRLGEKATDAAVSTLIGTQINRNHLRTDNVLGHIIDAKINKNKEIEVTCIFFKDIYEAEWDEAQELFSKNELTMSFELSADVESQDKLSDGTKRLNDYYFTGAGLLFGVKPACKKARVFEIATKKLQEKLNMERQSLIFANNQNSQKSIMEVLNLMADEVKKIEEVQAAEITVGTPVVEPTKAEEVVKVEEPAVVHVQAEEVKVEEPVKVEQPVVEAKVEEAVATPEVKVEEVKVEEAVKAEEPVKVEEPVVEAKVEEAGKAEEPVVEEKAAETIAQPEVAPSSEPVTVVTVTNQIVKDTMEENKETVQTQTESVRIVNNEVKEERHDVTEVTYTYSQMEEVKAKYETEITSLKEQLVAKDKEVETLKAAKKEEIVVAEEKPILATGHKKMEAAKEDVNDGNALVNILKHKKANRKN